MSGNTFGRLFRVTTAGESHGRANLAIIDGVPSGILLNETLIQIDLDKRRPGQSKITSQRNESDKVEILSGVFEGKSTGCPIALFIPNEDQRSKDYRDIKDKYRPGHADFTFDQKYGFRDYRGGGRSSARETVARVAAGAIAKQILKQLNIELIAYVKQIGNEFSNIDVNTVDRNSVEENMVRCPDQNAASRMIKLIEATRKRGNSIGGISEIIVRNCPIGLGEPVFDKLRADLGKALFSLPAVQGVEFGSGFGFATKYGTESNDIFINVNNQVKTRTNNHGGMLGGISTGMPIICRAVVKATSSLPKMQETLTTKGEKTTISTNGRHDPCLLPRFVPMAEAMVAITLVDHILRNNAVKLTKKY